MININKQEHVYCSLHLEIFYSYFNIIDTFCHPICFIFCTLKYYLNSFIAFTRLKKESMAPKSMLQISNGPDSKSAQNHVVEPYKQVWSPLQQSILYN